jgi:hypothetical protein
MTTSVATVRGDVRDDDVEVGRLHQSYIQRMSVIRYMSAGNEPKLTNAIRVYCTHPYDQGGSVQWKWDLIFWSAYS